MRTRRTAATLVAAGYVRVNGRRVETAARPVKPGDVLTIALDRRVRVLKVVGLAPRRGSAGTARGLYEDVGASLPADTALRASCPGQSQHK